MIQVSQNHACVDQSECFYERSGIVWNHADQDQRDPASRQQDKRNGHYVRGILQRTHLGWASASALQANRGQSVAGSANYPQAGPWQARKKIKSKKPEMG
jgi:hypothetical protein